MSDGGSSTVLLFNIFFNLISSVSVCRRIISDFNAEYLFLAGGALIIPLAVW